MDNGEHHGFLFRAQNTIADYAAWAIVIVGFALNVLDLFGLLDSIRPLHDKINIINALLVVGFILTYFKTANKIDSVAESIKILEDALGAKLKEKKNLDIFISAPITSFLPESNREKDFKAAEYKYFNRLCTHVVKSLQKEYPNLRIHYEGVPLTTCSKVLGFKNDKGRRAKSFERINSSKHLIAIFPDAKLISGSLVEIGYALAKGLSCVMFYPSSSKPLSIPSITIENSGRPSEGKCINQSYETAKTPEETADGILKYVRRDWID
jgi:hypothetical protein